MTVNPQNPGSNARYGEFVESTGKPSGPTCPNCTAPLDTKKDLPYTLCEYCGSVVKNPDFEDENAPKPPKEEDIDREIERLQAKAAQYEADGEWEKAITCYEMVLELDGYDFDAKAGIKRLKKALETEEANDRARHEQEARSGMTIGQSSGSYYEGKRCPVCGSIGFEIVKDSPHLGRGLLGAAAGAAFFGPVGMVAGACIGAGANRSRHYKCKKCGAVFQ